MAQQQTQLPPGQLTKYPVGSLTELWALSYPLMVSFLSMGIMVFVDRLFLCRLSYDAFNAASEACTFFITLEFSLVSLVGIAEVFVGRFYGARDFQSVARPVWAMIWLSLFSAVLFWPAGIYCPEMIFSHSPYAALETSFFRSLTAFGPIFLINTALSAFWIGRGKSRFVTICAIVANAINIILDPLLIFGIGLFPRLEIAGAGIATGISQVIQAVFMFACFLRKKYRDRYRTGDFHLHWSALKEMISLGFAQSFSQFMQSSAWSVFFRIMTLASPQHILVAGIAQSIFILFNFVVEGVSKAASSIAANLIGAGRREEIAHISWAGVCLHTVFAVILGIILVICPDYVASLFIPEDGIILGFNARAVVHASLFWIWLTLIGESLLFLWSGLLVALGDTRFILVTASSLIWIMAVLPAYIVTMGWQQPANVACAVICLYYAITGFAYYVRLNNTLKTKREIALKLMELN